MILDNSFYLTFRQQVVPIRRTYPQLKVKKQLSDYYSCAYGRFAIHEKWKENVVFFQHDLVYDYALVEMQVAEFAAAERIDRQRGAT